MITAVLSALNCNTMCNTFGRGGVLFLSNTQVLFYQEIHHVIIVVSRFECKKQLKISLGTKVILYFTTLVRRGACSGSYLVLRAYSDGW